MVCRNLVRTCRCSGCTLVHLVIFLFLAPPISFILSRPPLLETIKQWSRHAEQWRAFNSEEYDATSEKLKQEAAESFLFMASEERHDLSLSDTLNSLTIFFMIFMIPYPRLV